MEKEKSLLEQARIDKTRAEETISAARNTSWDDEEVLENLQESAEEHHRQELDKEHELALLEDVLRKGRVVNGMSREEQSEYNKNRQYFFKGFKYQRWVEQSEANVLVQITDESPEDCETCAHRLKQVVDSGLFENHPDRMFVVKNRNIYMKFEKLHGENGLDSVERVLGWKT